ncbi:hypothetical protein [Algoriphagus ornithinivorans]|nr:hypothetical protein [Algoriphagus ornithinivorans]
MKNPFWYPIRSVNKCLIIPFVFICFQSIGQERSATYFYSSNEQIPLAYLRVQVEGGSFMDFTDLAGKLEYLKKEIPENALINISGYGINDTLLSIKEIWNLDTIFLPSKEFELPEVAVNSTKLSELKIGDAKAEGWQATKPIGLIGSAQGEFYRYTIRVKIPKKKQLYLDKLKFYVSDILKEKVDVSIRILLPNNRMDIKPGKNNSIHDFSDLLQRNKVVEVLKPGWVQVNFDEYVGIPEGVKDLFIVFDLLEKEPKSNFALADQRVSKDIDLGFYITGGEIGVFNPDKFHPAIELTFFKE